MRVNTDRFLSSFRGNLFGGLTAGIIALPLALAFGVASGAGAAAGLYGAVALGLTAALFGGTRTQISGPTGPMTVITAAALVTFNGNFQAVLAAALLAGLFQVVFGFMRLGVFVKFIPYPVISGFMSGIGIIILLLQVHPLIGGTAVSSPLEAIVSLPGAIRGLNMQSLLIGAMTMAIVFGTPARFTRMLPSPLIALLAVSLFAYVAGFEIATIGDMPNQLPSLHFPGFSIGELGTIISLGLTLAVLGSIDSLLTSLVADSLTKEHHKSNRELIGQGIGNMTAALFGGIPGAGATMRTVVNIKAGGTSRTSGIIHSLFLFSILLGLGPLISHIPMALLAGILVKVGIDILDYRLLKVIKKAPVHDLLVMIIVFFMTVFVDLMVAVGVGVTLSALLLTYRMAKQTNIMILDDPYDIEPGPQLDQAVQQQTDYQIRVISIQGPFFFGSTSQVVAKVDQLLGTKVVVFNCCEVPFMDLSAVFALEEMIDKLLEKGIKVIMVTRPQTRQKLLGLGFDKKLGSNGIFLSHEEALQAAQSLLQEKQKAGIATALPPMGMPPDTLFETGSQNREYEQ